jgi:hypothetical protein
MNVHVDWLPTADATRWSPGHSTTTVAPIFTRP